MSSGLEDGLDYKDIAFVNEMSECPIQATASRMPGSQSALPLIESQASIGEPEASRNSASGASRSWY